MLKQKQELISTINNKNWTIEIISQKNKNNQFNQVDPENNFVELSGDNSTVIFGNTKEGNNTESLFIAGNVTDFNVTESLIPGTDISINWSIEASIVGHAFVSVQMNSNGDAIIELNPSTGEKVVFKGRILA